jgi:hypothetical protein
LIVWYFLDIPEAGIALKIVEIPIEITQTQDRSIGIAVYPSQCLEDIPEAASFERLYKRRGAMHHRADVAGIAGIH